LGKKVMRLHKACRQVFRRQLWLWLCVVALAGVSLAGGASAATSGFQLGKVVEEKSQQIAPDTLHRSLALSSSAGPQQVQVVRVNLNNPWMRLKTSLGGGQVVGTSRLSEQARANSGPEHEVVAGVNGDFFSTGNLRGIPSDVLIHEGELVASPGSGYAFGVTASGRPLIGKPDWQVRVVVNGVEYPVNLVNRERKADSLVLYTPRFAPSTLSNAYGTEVVLSAEEASLRPGRSIQATVRAVYEQVGNAPLEEDTLVLSAHGKAREVLAGLVEGSQIEVRVELGPPWDQVVEAVGGHPLLVAEGQIRIDPRNASFDSRPEPRTAVGYTAQGEVLMVTVDGRQPGVSEGVTIPQLAQLMRDLGAVYALNLDGGGSTTMVVRDLGQEEIRVANRPPGGVERAVSNGLLLVNTAPRGPVARLFVEPAEVRLLAGSRFAFSLRGVDAHLHPARIDETPSWEVSTGLGTIDQTGLLQTVRGSKGSHQVTVHVGQAAGTAKVEVVDRPARIEVTPAQLKVDKNTPHSLTVRAYDERGNRLVASNDLFSWKVSGNIGSIDGTGNFLSGATDARGEIIVSYGALSARVPVVVGEPKAPSFKDIAGTGAEEQIEALAAAGILRGYPDGTFRPNQPMTRAQLAKVLALSAGWEANPQAAAKFVDVKDEEQKRYVGALVAQGITKGRTENRFDPNGPLTREQVATFFIRSMGLEPLAQQLADRLVPHMPFTDAQRISAVHRANVALAAEIGFLSGIPNGDGTYAFNPKGTTKRQQMARLAYNFKFSAEMYKEKAEALKGK
jgi:hypothetical protein